MIIFIKKTKRTNVKLRNILNSIILLSLVLVSCNTPISPQDKSDKGDEINKDYYNEKHRPQFHFSPEKAWMNDPNGMVYYDGEYHLFYQYYPDSTVWGPMHWGHAVSKNLTSWEHLPIALYPDELGYIFSGSAVIDWKNTSGFGKDGLPPMVAIYSYHDMVKEKAGDDDFQTQGIAYSLDKGRTWIKYKNNPVIKNPGIRDFRDPKVIWHEDSQQWVMAVAALDHLMIYGSKNLIDWNVLSEFGKNIGNHDGVWECPDLFPIISDTGKEYWVLIQNMGTGNPNGGSGTQYFIGQFDGQSFTVDENFMTLLKTQNAIIPKGKIFDSFENGYNKWTVEGEAFSKGPALWKSQNKNSHTDKKGNKMASSLHSGDTAKGSLTSQPFTIEKNAINFLIGGGNHRGRTFIGLLIDGNIVRQAEGKNSEVLNWTGWDVSGYIGKTAQLKIVDDYTGSHGHIMIDDITFADKTAASAQSGSVWLDAGRDNYAGVTWSDVPASDGRRIFIGWLSNWAYAQVVPTEKWRSAMTIPWELSINHVDGIPRLIGQPAKELENLAAGDWQTIDSQVQRIELPSSGLAELKMTIDISNNADFNFELSNDLDEKIKFSLEDGIYKLDRTKSGDMSFSNEFTGIHKAKRISKKSKIQLHAYIDHSSIEIFLDDGQNVFTDLYFPTETWKYIKINGKTIESLKIRELNSIWP